MAGYLIKDTTREEREQIVAESLGYMEANCDGVRPDWQRCIRHTSMGRRSFGTLIWSFMQDMSRGRKYRGEDPARCKDSKHKVSKFAKTLSIREKPEKRDADAEDLIIIVNLENGKAQLEFKLPEEFLTAGGRLRCEWKYGRQQEAVALFFMEIIGMWIRIR